MESSLYIPLIIFFFIIGLFLYKYKKARSTLIEISYNNPSNFNEPPQAYIDLNNTFRNALFVGGGEGLPDRLLIKDNNGMIIDLIDQTGLSSRSATYDVVVADLDYNGYSDLIIARKNGVFFYKNKGKGRFKMEKISDNPDKIPLQVNVLDYNKDGHADIFISSQNKGPSKLLEGLGGGIMFEDVTSLVGNSSKPILQNEKNIFARDINNDRILDFLTDDGTVYQGTRGASGDKFTSGFQFIKRSHGFFKKGNFKDVIEAGKQSFNWLNLHNKSNKNEQLNFVGVKIPDRIPFFNSTLNLVTINEQTGKIRKQYKQVKGGEDIIRFNIGNDNKVLHLSVRTIYENTYEHPHPKVNVISSFRDAKW